MRRTASEVLHELEMRVARLEARTSATSGAPFQPYSGRSLPLNIPHPTLLDTCVIKSLIERETDDGSVFVSAKVAGKGVAFNCYYNESNYTRATIDAQDLRKPEVQHLLQEVQFRYSIPSGLTPQEAVAEAVCFEGVQGKTLVACLNKYLPRK
jgi:hypothetical protein